MRKVQLSIVGTGADLNIELGMIPDRVTITNIAKRTALEIGAVDGTIGYAIAVDAAGARTDGAATVDFLEGGADAGTFTGKGLLLNAAATVNVSGDTLFVEYECFN